MDAAKQFHADVLRVVESLMTGDPAIDTPQGQALSALAAAVSKYEKVAYPLSADGAICPACKGPCEAQAIVDDLHRKSIIEECAVAARGKDETWGGANWYLTGRIDAASDVRSLKNAAPQGTGSRAESSLEAPSPAAAAASPADERRLDIDAEQMVAWLKLWWSEDEFWRGMRRSSGFNLDVAHLMRGVADMIEMRGHTEYTRPEVARELEAFIEELSAYAAKDRCEACYGAGCVGIPGANCPACDGAGKNRLALAFKWLELEKKAAASSATAHIQPQRWYTREEMVDILRRMNYSQPIAQELADWMARHLQLAFNKGHQMGQAAACSSVAAQPATADIHLGMVPAERYEAVASFVRDLAERGTRFDTNPTMDYSTEQELWGNLIEYIQRMDKSIRERAKEALCAGRG